MRINVRKIKIIIIVIVLFFALAGCSELRNVSKEQAASFERTPEGFLSDIPDETEVIQTLANDTDFITPSPTKEFVDTTEMATGEEEIPNYELLDPTTVNINGLSLGMTIEEVTETVGLPLREEQHESPAIAGTELLYFYDWGIIFFEAYDYMQNTDFHVVVLRVETKGYSFVRTLKVGDSVDIALLKLGIILEDYNQEKGVIEKIYNNSTGEGYVEIDNSNNICRIELKFGDSLFDSFFVIFENGKVYGYGLGRNSN